MMFSHTIFDDAEKYEHIVIDAWHFHFIENTSSTWIKDCSLTTLETIKDGISLCNQLAEKGMTTLLHICGSDTNKYIQKDKREKYANYHWKIITPSEFSLVLPWNIARYLREQQIPHVLYTSQVKNTNLATWIIKKAKKSVKIYRMILNYPVITYE